MSEEKSFKPTKRRLDKARKEGKLLKSPIFAQLLFVTICSLTLFLWVRLSWVRIQILLEYLLTTGVNEPVACLRESLKLALEAVLTCLIPSCAVAIAAEGFQAGLRLDTEILKPKASRFSVVQGLRGIVAGLGQVWQPVLRLILFGAMCFWIFRLLAKRTAMFGAVNNPALALGEFGSAFSGIILIGGAVMVVSAGLDYLVRRRKFLRELSMDAAEMRQEHREEEGDPLVKATRKAMHESLLMQDLVQRVRKARVIVVERN